tara:strand:- start:2812 stop:3114 length:303 start_codon:yes stop_codon:yes gene_type:complete
LSVIFVQAFPKKRSLIQAQKALKKSMMPMYIGDYSMIPHDEIQLLNNLALDEMITEHFLVLNGIRLDYFPDDYVVDKRVYREWLKALYKEKVSRTVCAFN